MSGPINRMQLLRGDLRGEHIDIRPPWSKPEVLFTETCTRCDDCTKGCQEKLIRPGSGGYPTIDFSLGACTFCGDCVRACRTTALAFSVDPNQPPWSLSVEIKDNCLAMNGIVCRSCSERCDESAIHFQLQRRNFSLIGHHECTQRCRRCGEHGFDLSLWGGGELMEEMKREIN